jgi:hypothetical protein
MPIAIPKPSLQRLAEKTKIGKKNAPAKPATTQVIKSLTPDLAETLAILDNAPSGVPELTIATLGLGSRLTLRGTGIVDFDDDDKEGTTLKVTKLGYQVIAECAKQRTRTNVAEALTEAREELLTS